MCFSGSSSDFYGAGAALETVITKTVFYFDAFANARVSQVLQNFGGRRKLYLNFSVNFEATMTEPFKALAATHVPAFLAQVIDPAGTIEPGRFSAVLRLTKGELAMAAGLSRDAVSKTTRRTAPATQTRLREVAEIINRVLPWCGSVPQAFAWYRSQPLPAFGDQTPEDLVRAGRAAHLLDYLGGIALGGYA